MPRLPPQLGCPQILPSLPLLLSSLRRFPEPGFLDGIKGKTQSIAKMTNVRHSVLTLWSCFGHALSSTAAEPLLGLCKQCPGIAWPA